MKDDGAAWIGGFAILAFFAVIPFLTHAYPLPVMAIVVGGMMLSGLVGHILELRERRELINRGPHCPLCHTGLIDDVVSCRLCRTPHHRGCFQYSNGCAVFGCGSRRAIARPAALTTPAGSESASTSPS